MEEIIVLYFISSKLLLIKRLAITDGSTNQYEVLEQTVRSNTPGVSNAPHHSPSTGIHTASSKVLDILDPDLPIASATTSRVWF